MSPVDSMSLLSMSLLAFSFLSVAAIIAIAESGWTFVPRQELEKATGSIAAIRDSYPAHMNSLLFWRIWFEMAAAVAVALVVTSWVSNMWIGGALATVVMAACGFIFIGTGARQLGRKHPLIAIRSTSSLVRLLRFMIAPLLPVLLWVSSKIFRTPMREPVRFVTEDEFREIVDRASDEDVLEDAEADLIKSVFDIGDTLVREVMVPRTDVVSIQSQQRIKAAMRLFLRSGYSRMPVIGENADDVHGMLYLKDVAAAMLQGDEENSVSALLRDVQYVPDSKTVSDLLTEMQHRSTHVAIVVDEYGGTAGLVTLEDLIEEIVGEIVDEYDDAPLAEAVEQEDGSYIVSARMSVNDLAEVLDVELPSDGVDTVGGLLAKELGLVPIIGSEVDINHVRFEAVTMEGRRNRISQILVSKRPATQGEESGSEQAHPKHSQLSSEESHE